MSEPRFAFAIDPDRGPCHVGQLRQELDESRSPRTIPLYLRTDGGSPAVDGPLDAADLPTIGALAAWLLGHDPYDTVYAIDQQTGRGWHIVPSDSYELVGGREGLVLVLEEEG